MGINKLFRNYFKKYVFLKQYDQTDCAAACLTMIAKYYGLKIPLTKVREMAGTDRRGTNALGVLTAAEKLGFDAKAFRSDEKEFFGEFKLPAIAHVITETGLLHYVVIYRIEKEHLIIADPGKGIIQSKPEDFFKKWTGIMFVMSPNENFKRGDETKNIFQRFLSLMFPQKAILVNIFVASMICNAFGILGSFIFKIITDEVIPNRSYNLLAIISVSFLVLGVFKILFDAFRTQLLTILSQNIDMSLMLGFYKHLIHLPMRFFDNRKVGEITSRFMDSSKVREAISGVTLVLMIDTIMAVAGGIILYLENSFLFFISISIIVIYTTIVYLFNKPLREINIEMMENNAQLNSIIVESINGMQMVKSFNGEKVLFKKTEHKFIKLLRSIFKDSILINVESSLVAFVNSSGMLIIFWIGAMTVLSGKMTLGELLAFNALLAYFFDPIKNIINIQPMLQSAIVASNRLGEIFDVLPESKVDKSMKKTKVEDKNIRGEIIFKNVSFRYGTRDWVLKNINLTIKPGEKIALVGKSGSGKTTLAKLLMNLYMCEEGDIFIDNINLKEIDLEDLRSFISYIPQETFLFSDTIKYNLCLGRDISQSEIEEISIQTKTDEFVRMLANGYDSVLEENGANLSGGQKQRLAITRALLKKPKILIMDEATSNLDSLTEQAIEDTVNKRLNHVTRIVIAHRLSTVVNCDRIYVMENGIIVEAGTHLELVNKNGKYYKMVMEQINVSAG